MNSQHVENPTVISDRKDFTNKQIRSIKYLYKQSLKRGYVGKRPDSYIESVIFLGYGNALLDDEKRVLGFTVVRPLGIDPQNQEPILYGECTLWRSNDQFWEPLRSIFVDSTKRWHAHHLYGAFYQTNANAAGFHSTQEGFQRVPVNEVPKPIQKEIEHYDGIEVLHLTVH
ncbi:MAG: hypothetical protein ACJAVI_004002 [Candidatus Azotimanducaceae bacterium]|jgi:hypothetical protein